MIFRAGQACCVYDEDASRCYTFQLFSSLVNSIVVLSPLLTKIYEIVSEFLSKACYPTVVNAVMIISLKFKAPNNPTKTCSPTLAGTGTAHCTRTAHWTLLSALGLGFNCRWYAVCLLSSWEIYYEVPKRNQSACRDRHLCALSASAWFVLCSEWLIPRVRAGPCTRLFAHYLQFAESSILCRYVGSRC